MNQPQAPVGLCEPGSYEIQVNGVIDDRWADRFGSLAFTGEDDGSTTLQVRVADQSALHGVFNTLRDLGLAIISVKSVNSYEEGARTMKAIVTEKYGSPDVLELRDVEIPEVTDNQVLVRVKAASANAGDWHLLRARPFFIRFMFGLLKPKFKVLGTDVAGVVEAVGSGVDEFRPGDQVFGDISGAGYGAFAEKVSVPAKALALKPANLSFEEAAAVPAAALAALQGLRDHGHMQAGQKVLVNGASGGVGTFAVQIARSLGAEVTGVCSTKNVDMVRSIGANRVIDYTKDDVTKTGETFDVVLDTAAFRSISDYKRVLKPDGKYVLVGGSTARFLQAAFQGTWLSMTGSQKFGTFVVKPNNADLATIKELIESGALKPVIDRRYPLCEVPDAIRYLEEGHTQGKVVITV